VSTDTSKPAWRGEAEVDEQEAAEAAERLTAGLPGVDSRRLLRDLLTPSRRMLQLIVGIVLIENAARLAIPFLVKEGIDTGIPPIQASNDLQPLLTIVAPLARVVLRVDRIQDLLRHLATEVGGPVGRLD